MPGNCVLHEKYVQFVEVISENWGAAGGRKRVAFNHGVTNRTTNKWNARFPYDVLGFAQAAV